MKEVNKLLKRGAISVETFELIVENQYHLRKPTPYSERYKIKKEKNILYEKYKRHVYAVSKINAKGMELFDNRGYNTYSIDHIVPVSMGYKLGITPEKISSVENLRIIKHSDNVSKGSKLILESITILQKWGYELS